MIIPAYNEAENIPAMLSDVIKICEMKNWKVIFVNDGSKDQTRSVLKPFEGAGVLTVVHHKVNRGYGGAIKSGIRLVTTKYCVTIDADGQHDLADVEKVLHQMIANDADLIVGNRKGSNASGWYRELGKSIIRRIARILMPLKVYDINSGFKMYDAELAKKYIEICPDSMAYSDIITLTFVYRKHLVLEMPINIHKRLAGESTIGARTAFETVIEILNIVVLFNPMRIFLPLAFTFIIISVIWEVPILLRGNGISIGALLGFMIGIILFLLGLIAEQLGNIRRFNVNR